MKIIRIKENNKIHFGYLIEENSEEGIKQAIKEKLLSLKDFDIYNQGTGINYFEALYNDFDAESILILQEDIKTQLLDIPYIWKTLSVDVKKINVDNIKKIVINVCVLYLDVNEKIQKISLDVVYEY